MNDPKWSINPEWVKCLEWDIQAYRGALGYEIPGGHTGKLSDGTIPTCGMCNSQWSRESESLAELVRWLMQGKYRHLIHRHDGCFRAVDETLNVFWESDRIESLMQLIKSNPVTTRAP